MRLRISGPSAFAADYQTVGLVAAAEWTRLGARSDLSAVDRVTLISDLVWNMGYELGYRTAYAAVRTDVAGRAAASIQGDRDAELGVRRCLRRLIEATDPVGHDRPLFVPPTPAPTLAAAVAAADEPGLVTPCQAAARLAWDGALRAGVLTGTVTAATDTLTGWRARGGAAGLERVRIAGKPAVEWVGDLLAQVNRDVAARWVTPVPAASRNPHQVHRHAAAARPRGRRR